MITCHLSRLLGEKRLKIGDVGRDTNINRGTFTRMFHETASSIDLAVLDTLCQNLDCEICELYERQEEEESYNT